MNRLLFCAGLLGLFSVIMGAAGDHLFTLTGDQGESLDTAIRYNMLYAVLTAAIAMVRPAAKLSWAGILFAAGAAVFSGSIYAALMTGIGGLTYLTPVGGITIMAGWLMLSLSALRHRPE